MAKYRTLSHSPIIEAIIDFRVALSEDFEPKRFLELKQKWDLNFPHIEERRITEGKIALELVQASVNDVNVSETLIGYLFRSKDGTEVVQCRVDGFTFSRLKPYTNWNNVFEKAEKLWKDYLKIANAEFINRLAIRYINHLKIPQPWTSKEFLTIVPDLPKEIQDAPEQSLLQMTIPKAKDKIVTNFIQAIVESNKEYATVYIDIEVFKRIESLKAENSKEIHATFEKLKEIRTNYFFGSITERMAEVLNDTHINS